MKKNGICADPSATRLKTRTKCHACLQVNTLYVSRTAEIMILLPKLSTHCLNSVYVASISGSSFCLLHVKTTYFFTLKTIDHLDLPHTTPSYSNLQKYLQYVSGV